MHFELQHVRRLENMPLTWIRASFRRLRKNRRIISDVAFSISLFLNLYIMVSMTYQGKDEQEGDFALGDARRGMPPSAARSQDWETNRSTYTFSEADEYFFRGKRDVQVLSLLLGVLLLPLYVLQLLEFLFFTLPVDLYKKYSQGNKVPFLSVFQVSACPLRCATTCHSGPCASAAEAPS